MLYAGKTIMRRLPNGADLYNELTRIAVDEDIELGTISGIGALSEAALGFWDPQTNQYKTNKFAEQCEICSLLGNISLKEGEPFVHAHLTISNADGNVFGGHCFEGCKIVVCEVVIRELLGDELVRVPQKDVGGLFLWDIVD